MPEIYNLLRQGTRMSGDCLPAKRITLQQRDPRKTNKRRLACGRPIDSAAHSLASAS